MKLQYLGFLPFLIVYIIGIYNLWKHEMQIFGYDNLFVSFCALIAAIVTMGVAIVLLIGGIVIGFAGFK